MRDYFKSFWNQTDIIASLLFIAAVIMGNIKPFITLSAETTESLYVAARILLAISTMVYFFRILNLLTISKTLGPKVMMVYRMVCLKYLPFYFKSNETNYCTGNFNWHILNKPSYHIIFEPMS